MKSKEREESLSIIVRRKGHSTIQSAPQTLRLTLLALVSLAALGLGLGASVASAQESAWVRGEIRLNVRSGPGTEFRILGGVATGAPKY